MAALSHTAMILPYIGIVVPLGIWISQRDKSNWLRFQALQALVFQVLQFVIMTLVACFLIPLILSMMISTAENPDTIFGSLFIIQLLPFLFWALLILLGLFAGVMCAFGRDFHYPILGRILTRYLEENDENSVTGGDND